MNGANASRGNEEERGGRFKQRRDTSGVNKSGENSLKLFDAEA